MSDVKPDPKRCCFCGKADEKVSTSSSSGGIGCLEVFICCILAMVCGPCIFEGCQTDGSLYGRMDRIEKKIDVLNQKLSGETPRPSFETDSPEVKGE